jgi:hypothetical protein
MDLMAPTTVQLARHVSQTVGWAGGVYGFVLHLLVQDIASTCCNTLSQQQPAHQLTVKSHAQCTGAQVPRTADQPLFAAPSPSSCLVLFAH